MIFLHSTSSSSKSIFVMVDSSPTSPSLGRGPSVCLVCCLLCSCLACCWVCSHVCCWLCSFRFFDSFLAFSTLNIALLRCSSRCPRTRVAPSTSFHHWLLGSGSVSDSHQRHLVDVHIFLVASSAPPTQLLNIAPFVIVGSR